MKKTLHLAKTDSFAITITLSRASTISFNKLVWKGFMTGVPNFLALHVSLLEKSISLSQESEWNNPIYNVTSTNDWISTYTHCSLKKNFQPKISLPFPMHNNTRFWWMGTKSFWQTWTNSREWFEMLYIPVFFLAQKAEY